MDEPNLIHYDNFATQTIPARPVDIWLPPGYAGRPQQRYPVLYMHDGQNLFDTGLAYGGVDWGISEAVQRLMQIQQHAGVIVVGIWHGGDQRWREYMPQKPLALPQAVDQRRRFIEHAGGLPYSDLYLKFLVSELKPFVDANYRTQPEQPQTFIMGSSMGGLISLYALLEYPQVFGGAGCVSTHWPAGEEPVLDWLAAAVPQPGRHKLYFDFGDQTLDSLYEPYQQRMDHHLAAAGYTLGRDWLTRKFPGAEHSERAWRLRVDLPLQFLLG